MDTITIDTSLDAPAAIGIYKDAEAKLIQSKDIARRIGCGLPGNLAQLEHEVMRTRVQAQYAIKRVTGFFPVDLAFMGL